MKIMQRIKSLSKTKIAIIAGVVLILVAGIWFFFINDSAQSNSDQTTALDKDQANSANYNTDVVWTFNGTTWDPDKTPPGCREPINLASPVDLSLATGVLYPGQSRGGTYKPHGGFEFSGQKNDNITVKMPYDAKLISGSRYLEQGETQYLLNFTAPCGLRFRFDHLLTLSPDMQNTVEELPAAKVNDKRTTNFAKPVDVKTGDTLATAVGFKTNTIVAFDFGVYDLRNYNLATKDNTYTSQHAKDIENAYYAICWLDWFSGAEHSTVTALPAGDPEAGKTSDYCK